jgi:branched-chain amino acid transport system permease protein
MGSLKGAFMASLLIGLLQTLAVGSDSLTKIAPILPYLILVLMLIFRPKGLLGSREA